MAEAQTENVVGAVMFYSYIAAALFFTGFIGRDLSKLYMATYDVRKIKGMSVADIARRRNKAHYFAALSTISFAVLSYQMLSFLVQSYSTWSVVSGVTLPIRLFGEEGIFDLHGRRISLSLWTWSTQSTLFRQFAEVIVNDPRRYWWTQQALLYSLGWNIFMVIEGTRCQIPHLWTYFVLDQILPVSFTQNLFCTAVYLSQNYTQASNMKPAAPGDQFVVVSFYLLGLAMVPGAVGEPAFFFILFSIRALLFSPVWMMKPSFRSPAPVAGGSEKAVFWQYRYSALVLAIGGLYLHLRQTQAALPLVDAAKAINDSPAVAALAYDYLIGIISLVTLVCLRTSRQTQAQPRI